MHFVATEPETAEVTLHLSPFPQGAFGGNGFVDGAVQWQVSNVLTVVRHGGTGPHFHATGIRRMLLHQRFNQGAFAGAVWAHQRHHFIALEHHVHVAQQFACASRRVHGHGHMFGFDHAVAAAIARR